MIVARVINNMHKITMTRTRTIYGDDAFQISMSKSADLESERSMVVALFFFFFPVRSTVYLCNRFRAIHSLLLPSECVLPTLLSMPPPAYIATTVTARVLAVSAVGIGSYVHVSLPTWQDHPLIPLLQGRAPVVYTHAKGVSR